MREKVGKTIENQEVSVKFKKGDKVFISVWES